MIILSALIGCVSMQFVMRWKTLKAAMFVTFQRYLHYFSAPSERRISVLLNQMSTKTTPTMMRLTSKFHPTPDGVFPISLTSYCGAAAVLTQACRLLKFLFA